MNVQLWCDTVVTYGADTDGGNILLHEDSQTILGLCLPWFYSVYYSWHDLKAHYVDHWYNGTLWAQWGFIKRRA